MTNSHVLQTFTFPPGSGHLRPPAAIDPTLDLCTRYPLQLGGPRQCGIQSFPNTSAHAQHRELDPRTFWSWVQCPIHLATWQKSCIQTARSSVIQWCQNIYSLYKSSSHPLWNGKLTSLLGICKAVDVWILWVWVHYVYSWTASLSWLCNSRPVDLCCRRFWRDVLFQFLQMLWPCYKEVARGGTNERMSVSAVKFLS